MTWIKTETARFIEEEIVAVQFLPSNYSCANSEFTIFLRGGCQMKFIGDEATRLWAKYGENLQETASEK